MSEAFERYERQYCQLCDNLSNKCTSATLLDGEQKKQKLSEVAAGLDNAESLIKEMDVEARNLQPNVKAVLLAKLREYKSDLDNLKSETKQTSLPNSSNEAARDELLEAGMADTLLTAPTDHKARLLLPTQRREQSSDEIRESRKTIQETEELAVPILQDLDSKRQPFLHAHNTSHDVDDNKGRRILTSMSRRMSRNQWISSAIIAALIVAVVLILYFIISN